MKSPKILFLTIALIVGITCGCSEPPEQTARNVIASASGAISSAQANYTKSCTANPAQKVCQSINRTIDGENAAITSLETYCSFELAPVLPDPSRKCVPVKGALSGLQAAVSNLNQLIGELKGTAGISYLNKQGEKFPPLSIPIDEASLTPGAISLALLGLKLLLQNLLKGQAGEYSQEAIDAAQGAITELEQVQGTDVTFGQLESLRLHKLWPDVPPAGSTPSTPSGTPTQ